MRRYLALLPLTVGIACAAALTAHGTASAVTSVPPAPCAPIVPPSIQVMSGAYTPSTLGLTRPGSTVTWNFFSPAASVTSTNMTLFNSGVKSSGTYKFDFWSAGTFTYDSSTNAAEKGKITVRMCNVPATAKVGSTVYMQPASSHRTDWVADIEVHRPGATSWTWLKYGVATTMTTFVPTVKGSYVLRARLRHTTNNQFSGFSPISIVKVS